MSICNQSTRLRKICNHAVSGVALSLVLWAPTNFAQTNTPKPTATGNASNPPHSAAFVNCPGDIPCSFGPSNIQQADEGGSANNVPISANCPVGYVPTGDIAAYCATPDVAFDSLDCTTNSDGSYSFTGNFQQTSKNGVGSVTFYMTCKPVPTDGSAVSYSITNGIKKDGGCSGIGTNATTCIATS